MLENRPGRGMKYWPWAVLIIAGMISIVLLLVFFLAPGNKEDAQQVPVEKAGLFALVLDDLGYNRRNLDALKDIGIPLTVAVLPNAPYSGAVCSFAEENGLDVILHLPMEPEDRTVATEEHTISGDMPDEAVKENISAAFCSVYAAKGMSNHMGSKATGDCRLMAVVFDDLKRRRMFFLDSFTTGNSVCAETAQDAGIPYIRRDIFIDNVREKDSIKRQMEKAEKKAHADGSVVAIGHDRKMTIDVLRELVPGMKARGIRFVKLSELVALSKTGDGP